MSPRPRSRGRAKFLVVAAVAALGVTLCGCSAVLTGLYLVKGIETPAEFEELKGKKTAVVCRPLVELQYSSSSAAEQLALTVGLLMKDKIKKVEVVSPQKIEQWTDEHDWDDFAEVGKAMKSDYVVGIEIEEFNLYQGQTIYQGRAKLHVTVHDMSKKGELVYDRRLPEIVYPPNSGVPTSDKTEDEFRRQFTGVVAERVGRLFYGFDHRKDMALDSTTL